MNRTLTVLSRGLFKRKFSFNSGPYREKPAEAFGICLLENPDVMIRQFEGLARGPDIDVWIPIPDFGVPAELLTPIVEFALIRALAAALDGRSVYVGCMGGIGRTGLFLSLLAKALGQRRPIGYVRRYVFEAVETHEQELYVRNFPIGRVRRWLFGELIKRRLTKIFRRG